MRVISSVGVCLAACTGVALAAPAPLAVSAPTADKTAFVVTCTPLGPQARERDVSDAFGYFVSRLDARPDFTARKSDSAAPAWNGPPAGVPPERWISLVPVCFGPRTDWLAFRFEPSGAALSFAARRPSKERVLSGIYEHTIPPGPDQTSRNACIELAADAGRAAAHPAPAAASARPLRIRVLPPGQAGSGEPSLAALLGESAEPAEAEAAAAQPATENEARALTALLWAAAFAAGFTPTSADAAPESLAFAASRQVLSYGLDLSLDGGAAPRRATRQDVPRESLYPVAFALLRALASPSPPAADFGQVDDRPAALLGARGDRVFLARDGVARCFSALTGARLWETPASDRVLPRFTWWSGPETEPVLFQWSPSLETIAFDQGASGSPAGRVAGPSWPWGLDAAAGGVLAVARDRTLTVYDGPAVRWTRATVESIDGGPLLAGGGVLAGCRDGLLLARAAADGEPLWQVRVAGRPFGPIGRAAALALAATREGVLHALSLADGRIVWQADLGDALLGAARPAGEGRLFAATRDGVLRLLDVQTGRVTSERRWPGRLVGAACAGGAAPIACAEAGGTVALLSPADLSVLRQTSLGARLNPGLVLAPDFPRRWGSRSEVVDRGPTLLATDSDGLLHLLPAEASP